jgi:hypothetical protein
LKQSAVVAKMSSSSSSVNPNQQQSNGDSNGTTVMTATNSANNNKEATKAATKQQPDEMVQTMSTSALEAKLRQLRQASQEHSQILTQKLASSQGGSAGQNLLHIGTSLSTLPPDLHNLSTQLHPVFCNTVENVERNHILALQALVQQATAVRAAGRRVTTAAEAADLYADFCAAEKSVRLLQSSLRRNGAGGSGGSGASAGYFDGKKKGGQQQRHTSRQSQQNGDDDESDNDDNKDDIHENGDILGMCCNVFVDLRGFLALVTKTSSIISLSLSPLRPNVFMLVDATLQNTRRTSSCSVLGTSGTRYTLLGGRVACRQSTRFRSHCIIHQTTDRYQRWWWW